MIRLRAFVAVAIALTATVAAADERGYQLLNTNVSKPAPLVVALHCYGCSPMQLTHQLGLDALAKRHGFVVAVPAGLTDRTGTTFWNATDACCDFYGQKPDDVGYVMRVIDELVKKGIADKRRVYLVGFSNGGFLAHRLACDHADKIAAIVSIGGGAPATCKPSSPVAVLDIHGEADSVVPAAGGTLGNGLPQRATFPSARTALETWARVDGCARADAAGHRRCAHGAVDLWMLPGGHWPQMDVGFDERLWEWLAAQHK